MDYPTSIEMTKDSAGRLTHIKINIYSAVSNKYITFNVDIPPKAAEPNRAAARRIVSAIVRISSFIDPSNDEPFIVAKNTVRDLAPEQSHYTSVIEAYRIADDRQARFDAAVLGSLAGKLPGFDRNITHPVTGVEMLLGPTVIGLNDKYEWSRDKIADWLDSLHESGTLDLSFKDRPEETSIEDK